MSEHRGFVMIRPITRMWLILLIGAMLVSCVAPRGGEGPIQTYRLSVEPATWEAEARNQERNSGYTLLVNVPRAEAGFDTPRMAYVRRPYEVRYYAVNQWADTPARMLAPLLVRHLERSRSWGTVVPLPASIPGDYRLDSHGLSLQQEFVEEPSRVRLMVQMQLVELREHRVVGTRRFEMVEQSTSEDAYGGVVAANRAVLRLLEDVAEWLDTCAKDLAQGHC